VLNANKGDISDFVFIRYNFYSKLPDLTLIPRVLLYPIIIFVHN